MARVGYFNRGLLLAVGILAAATAGFAQIGGHTAADGPFVLEDAEDGNLNAAGVGRDWISDFVAGVSSPLQVISPAGEGLAPAPWQSSGCALRFRTSASSGYLNKSFGVPLPSMPGSSTLTNPGNLTSFSHLSFAACYSGSFSDQEFQVILETYPGTNSKYPKLYYKFIPAGGSQFQRVAIDLRSPAHVENAGSLSIEQLLSQTRYLSFYFYGGPTQVARTFSFYVDDIRFTLGRSTLAPGKLLRIRSDGWDFQEVYHSYTSGGTWVSPYFGADAAVSFYCPANEWTGIYHYDYRRQGFTEAVYRRRQPLGQ